ncbi:MAG: ABC transporter permease [Rubrobacteraceae bacterium]
MTSAQKTEERTELDQREQEPEGNGQKKQQKSGPGADKIARTFARYLIMPVFLIAVCGALYLWVGSLQLDSIEQRTLNQGYIIQRVVQHLQLTGVATVLVVVISVSAGVLFTRDFMSRVSPYIVSVGSIGQAIPSIGVLALLAVSGFFGFRAAIVGLVIYAFLPVLRNTMVGIRQVDSSVIEAGRGMGMTKTAVLFRIELPLAIPIMLAGIRTALIIVVGTATLATFINAGGMGDIIVTGIKLSRDSILVTGSVLTGVLALTIDYIAGVVEDILRPKGL